MVDDQKVKRLTESALLMAVSIVLFMGAFIPLAGIFIAPFCPVPLCIITSRYGIRYGSFIAFVTVICLSLLFSVVIGGAFVPFIFTGILIGALGRYKGTPLSAVVLGILAMLVMFLTAFYGYNAIALRNTNLLTVHQMIDEKFEYFEKRISDYELKLKADSSDETKNNQTIMIWQTVLTQVKVPLKQIRILVLAVMFFPLAFFFVLSSLGFSVSFLIATSLSERLGFALPKLPPFSEWRGKWYVTIGVVLYWAGTIVTSSGGPGMQLWSLYLMNFSFILLLYYVVLGFSLMSFGMKQLGLGHIIQFFLMLLTFRYFTLGSWPVLPLSALLDSWFNLRSFKVSHSE
jgi:hypothetical protein